MQNSQPIPSKRDAYFLIKDAVMGIRPHQYLSWLQRGVCWLFSISPEKMFYISAQISVNARDLEVGDVLLTSRDIAWRVLKVSPETFEAEIETLTTFAVYSVPNIIGKVIYKGNYGLKAS